MDVIESPNFLNLPAHVRPVFAAAGKESFFNLPEWYDLVARMGLEPGWQARLYATEHAALVTCARAAEIRGCCNMYTIEHVVLADTAEHARQNLALRDPEIPPADSILLPGLDPKDPRFQATLVGLKEAGFVAKPYFSWSIWFEPISEGFDAYLDARPSVLKNTWRRKLASLEKSAPIVFRTTTDIDTETFIAAYDAVYNRSWKEPEPFPGFMPHLMRVAARLGALRYGLLEAGGQPIAAQFWIAWGERAIIYKLAYDEKWSKFSPGTLLTMHMIRHVLERDRLEEINFGRGDDDYKKLWMSQRRERWGIEAANPRTARGLARAVRLRAALARDQLMKRKPRM